jgi:hypothetical protein
MKLQRCIFKRDEDSYWEPGVAKLKYGWGCHDVRLILDKDLNKIQTCFDYKLITGPGCYLEVY